MKALKVTDLTKKDLSSGNAIIKAKPGNMYCPCLGTRHPVVTNCISCGYLICEKVMAMSQQKVTSIPLQPMESLQDHNLAVISMVARKLCACPFCGADCYSVPSSKELEPYEVHPQTLAAYANNERLLTFDQEHTKRTVVRDAQGDYYANTTWLNEEEKKEMEDKENKRIAKRTKEKERKYTIRFDIAGRKIVEAVDSEEEEEEEGDGEGETQYEGKEKGHPDEHVIQYDNDELQLAHSQAGEVYRFIKQR
eukprot:scaffold1593_cov170-Ochromonas_danica.AAC.9